MGKPYAGELALLDKTYKNASAQDNEVLAGAIASQCNFPVLAVGSGGSLTTAHFVTYLHELFTGNIAKAITPMEVGAADLVASRAGVMFFSASGKNQDIVSSFERARAAEPRRMLVLCGREQSPLYRLGIETSEADAVSYEIPTGSDGFLATNSVVASCTLLAKAYLNVFKSSALLPSMLDELAVISLQRDGWISHIRRESDELWSREYLVVLFGRATRAAAWDVESRFHEAALGPVQIADYRNFAHGRHHWLAKHKERSGVLAFITPDEREVADRTLRLIPRGVPICRLETPATGSHAALAAVLWSIQLAGLAGAARGIDPGRPGVPEFGRKIYNLRAARSRTGKAGRVDNRTVGVRRKLSRGNDAWWDDDTRERWRHSANAFQLRLAAATFGAIAMDYDGTLCDRAERGKSLSREIRAELERVLEAGLFLGIATGRGHSVRSELRKSLKRKFWKSVLVGYYNGSDIGTLADDTRPDRSEVCDEALCAIANALETDRRFADLCRITKRRHQITLEPTSYLVHDLWPDVHDLALRVGTPSISVLRSAHSVDIVTNAASKRRVLDELRPLCETGASVLCIGDRGRWPGNDYELLLTEFSLSVDEVSTDPVTCWNFAPAGIRGIAATVFYLRALKAKRGRARLSL